SQACLEMLTLTVKDRPAALDLINRLQAAQDHLHHLFEDVRNYAAPIVLEPRRADLAEIWREAWSHLLEARPRGATELREHCDGPALQCHVDPFRLGQVFRNVLENALAAGKGRVAVEFRAEVAELAGKPAIRLAIHDEGPGIPLERRREVFEPFFT